MNEKIEIKRYGYNGEGVGEINKKITFVPFSIPGEICECRINNQEKNYQNAELVNVLKASEKRVAPICPYFAKCGGCALMHITYNEQLKLKKTVVENNLKKYGNIKFNVDDCQVSPKQLYYRNKVVFSISNNAKLGFFMINSHNVIEVQKCHIIDEKINKFISPINSILSKFRNQIYNWETRQGIYKNIEIRYYNDEYLFTIVQTTNDKSFAEALCDELNLHKINFSLYISINKKSNSLIYGELMDISKTKISHSPFAFLQVNNDVKQHIYNEIKNQTSGLVVVDAYAGRCELSSILAQNAKCVYAIEIERQSCEDAQKLKNSKKIDNLLIKNGDCASILPNICKNINIDTIILDPPRKGIDEKVVELILKIKPQEIIYLSCNSATLARDLKLILSANIYEINQITPYDMFPQTAEVETLVKLRIRNGKR